MSANDPFYGVNQILKVDGFTTHFFVSSWFTLSLTFTSRVTDTGTDVREGVQSLPDNLFPGTFFNFVRHAHELATNRRNLIKVTLQTLLKSVSYFEVRFYFKVRYEIPTLSPKTSDTRTLEEPTRT